MIRRLRGGTRINKARNETNIQRKRAAMKDTATIPDADNGHDARRQILEATARLIESGNTAIMPEGRIVPRGTPGAMDYQSANHRNLGPVNITPECRALQATNPDPTSTFVNYQGETIEVSKALVDVAAADIKAAMEDRKDAMMKAMIVREMTRPPGMEGEPAWIPCPDCDDHWCNLHGCHTHECACPPIDEWETDPYSPTGKRPAMPRPPIRVIMFRPEFEAPITAGTKHHTIRGTAKRPWKHPMLLSLRVWTGAPYRTPQREFMMVPLLSVEGIRIHSDGVELRPGTIGAFWMGEQGKRRDLLEAFARADGFATWDAMRGLFRDMRGIDREPFEGQLIRWKEPTR